MPDRDNDGDSVALIVFLVFAVFLSLKLLGVTEVAGWSWWWVCSPLWIPAAVLVAVCALAAIAAGVVVFVAFVVAAAHDALDAYRRRVRR